MGLFDLFRRKKKTINKRSSKHRTANSKQIFQKITKDIQNLQAQAGTTNIILHKHEQEISNHKMLIEGHSKQLDTLEQLVAKQPAYPANIALPAVNRPDVSINLPVAPSRQSQQQGQKFDIAGFSEQEKRILAVFFQNKDMPLSYADIGRYLGKSSNTIKNQLRQINMKADLFNYTIGNESRKKFKLKDGLKIENYLGISEEPASCSG
jgi:DNA-binding CsgD family transcriptional regulator